MKANAYIRSLFEKFISDKISESELQQLLDHFGAKENDESIMEQIRHVLESEYQPVDNNITQIGEEVKLKLDAQLRPKEKRIWLYLAAAAILLAISIAAIYVFDLGKIPQNDTIQTVQQQIQPGTDKAVLILSDGRRVSLTDSTNSLIKNSSGENIAQVIDGTLSYVSGNRNIKTDVSAYNTILVPKGGQYKVILPDGSKAWLNSGSSLRYPVSFGTQTRIMELSGEGYFDVVKNKKLPFTVKSSTLEVTALGTQFNVITYSNEPYGAATLVEGSLRVSDTKSQKTVLITPGEQAFSTAGNLKVRKVNTYELTAWKDGLFVISKAGLDEVMRQVERWYNVTIEVKLPETANTFSGEFPRNIALADFLQSLERATGIKFKIEGRRIVGR
ncbi:FecR family protein [Sphingobacterium detergens]|uniref:FecR family protein n=1 Tax=Sphingobacterium detergens TaxID=1145106 RepID=A0A420B6M0_SPHD1|nr:FecR domain-containing protein [Sphingobacterium detergens]RKE52394.1 FecR family protein [Sphingobacterium detergens]